MREFKHLYWLAVLVVVCVFIVSYLEHRIDVRTAPAPNRPANLATNYAVADRLVISNALRQLQTNVLSLTNLAEIKANHRLQATLHTHLAP